ncbi:MAG: sulfatase [Pirellulales bacterium]
MAACWLTAAIRPAPLAADQAAASVDKKPARPRQNVILVVADDLGWADLGVYGSKFHRTPQLDQFAASAARFTQAYAACPVCSPTRAALLTGRWPARLHLTDWLPGRGDLPAHRLKRPDFQRQLPLAETTLAELFRDAGYATASIGKWHLGGVGFGPLEQGFHVNIAGDAGGSPTGYFAPFQNKGRKIPGLDDAPAGQSLTERLTDEAIQFIDQQQTADKPFFLYLPHYAVHTPLQDDPERIAKFPADAVFRGSQNSSVYAAMLERLDAQFGRLLTHLRDKKIDDRTIVVFTSDNGGLATPEGPHTPATSNAPLREGKGWLYEGGLRVPLIVRAPGATRPGSVLEFPTSSVDLFPTLAELCGLRAASAVDGVSVAGVLRGDAPPDRDALYWHYPHYANQGGRPGGVIREGKYKLIEFYENGRRELFDMSRDMRENQNLAASEPEVVARLAAKLAAWRESVGAQMPTPNPDYVPHPQAQDGAVTLPASGASVAGVMLRYEPLPHKNTLGFWVRPEDTAHWEFTITRPGKFEVELLQGCGNGSGGSEVDVLVADQKLTHKVVETGGFQAFVPKAIGTVAIDKPGRYTLEIRPRTKPGPAVMDVRQVKLKWLE